MCDSADIDTYNDALLANKTRGNKVYSKARYYSCKDDSSHLVGTQSPFRECQENGTWTYPDFRCERKFLVALERNFFAKF